MDTLRIFLAMVAALDLECYQFDVKNAFTESYLKERIYMKPPSGITVRNGVALRIVRSLYGLKQAARDWNKLCKASLLEWGFTQSLADPCLFINNKKNMILLIYMDDIFIATKTLASVK